MSNRLKPCPFCGGTPAVKTRDVEPQGDTWYGAKIETFILCDCGCCLFGDVFHEGFGNAERSIAAWNRRSESDEIEDICAKLATAREALMALSVWKSLAALEELK